MSAYLVILFIVHIGGAIVGIGPTYAFSILGPSVGEAGPNGGAAILRAMLKIEHKIVTPVALITQPLSGALLIFETGRNHGFFSHTWLWVSILVYIVLMYLSFMVNTPAMERMLTYMDAPTGPPGPEIQKDIKTAQKLGPILGMMGVVIIILMIWKPGS